MKDVSQGFEDASPRSMVIVCQGFLIFPKVGFASVLRW
ncbi:hypothetical protein PDR5_06500 [Pseudomonas sp. DR 5-09]|nr:hypothetical protein PDR5_06500 [Pseudomonas sp. DR 5-09]